ncbi:hypothetical protein SAMN02910456_01229 [Ruminococcaceae bacterium YRB3002]|nr:hypothetical protein SAMN02910456_01229 [Ruminococcaceae bacterium YRB3002]
MNKLVYLFELDSVRKTDKEIWEGQKALCEELRGNGNTVVLTFNQLVDSRAFFCLLADEEYARDLVHLFEIGVIRISQFGDNRTISQYLLNSLSQDREFIYSGWPLKSTQKRLIALIRRSLTYSDLTEISDYVNGVYSKEELLDLFVEVKDGKEVRPEMKNYHECRFILWKMYNLLKTVLRLSFIHTIYIDPRKGDTQDRAMNLPKFLHNALSLKSSGGNTLWDKAVAVLNDLDDAVFCFEESSGSADRSVYYHAIRSKYDQAAAEDENTDKEPYQYAEAIVDLCYNYQLEYSICNSSKHYNINEFLAADEPESWVTFREDFRARLKQTWDMGDIDRRYLLDETNLFLEYGEEKWAEVEKIAGRLYIPIFEGAVDKTVDRIRKDLKRELKKVTKLMSETVRLLDYMNAKKEAEPTDKEEKFVYRYEHELRSQSRKHKTRIEASIGKNLLLTLPSIAVACGLEFAMQYLQAFTERFIPWNFFTETLIFLVVTEFITWALSKFIPGFLSLSDAVGNVRKLIRDFAITWAHNVDTYRNTCKVNTSMTERYNQGSHIDYILTEPIKKYIRLQKDRPELFVNPKEIMKVETVTNKNPNSRDAIKNMLRMEEIYGYHFGVIYRSEYNTWVVDPIINKPKNEKKTSPYYTYERAIPTGGDGTIAVTVHDGKLVLLDQFRHAPRKMQYAFPRGYNENKLMPLDNLAKEVDEEIGAESVVKPVYLGKINPDSGLTSGSANVYLVNVDKVVPTSDEGIVDTIEITEQKFEEMIAKKRDSGDGDSHFDDGYTLAAYALYKEYAARV